MKTYPAPDYESMGVWDCYQKQLDVEYRQSVDEGLDIEESKPLFDAVAAMPAGPGKEAEADRLYGIVRSARIKDGYPYVEPSELSAIRAEREPSDVPLFFPDRKTLADRIKGGWFGRICGCLLGKPVEGIGSGELRLILGRTGNFPMTRYIDREEITDAVAHGIKWNIRERAYPRDFGRMPSDDDVDYMMIAYLLLDRYGYGFTPGNVLETWIGEQSVKAYCTAERVAFLNYVKGYRPPDTALYKNPYREWIGAQIRGDVFGYVCPCDPGKAAELAFRDASVSHVKNGIYGEMWASATIAAAFGCGDIGSAIRRGLSEIPKRSRLHEAVTETMENYSSGVPADECFAGIHRRWDETDCHGWTHVIPNAQIVTAALLYGGGDYARTVGLAVGTGFDTDCNGATAGSVLGAALGFDALPRSFTDRVADTLETDMIDFRRVSITDMANKTLGLIDRLNG